MYGRISGSIMETTDLEAEIKKSRKTKPQREFSSNLFTEDGVTRYTATIKGEYSALDCYVQINLCREDLLKKIKKRYKLQLLPKPKLNVTEHLVDEYRLIWKISINELGFAWQLNDFNRWSEIGTYGLVGRNREIAESLESEAQRTGINLKDGLIDLLTGPYYSLQKEFEGYLEGRRRPMKEKGIANTVIIYSDEMDKLRAFSKN